MNDYQPRRRQAPGRRISIALAVAVHLVLAIFLIYGIRWQSQRPEAVEVELVRAVPTPAAEPAPPPEPKPEPVVEPKPEPKPVPPPPKPEIAIKEKKEKPKPPPKEEPKPRFDPLQQAMKLETEQLAQRKAADAAAAELAQIKAAQASAAHSKALADYAARIRAKIRGNIVLPHDIKGNPEAQFEVTQLPTGDILGVKLKKGSGHALLDAAIERAILKSSPLPKPERGELMERSLDIRYRPLDE